MSLQITIRLPDELADFVDRSVAEGRAASRADAVAQALTRERRRRLAERDVELLLAHRANGGDRNAAGELDALAEQSFTTPLDVD